MSEAKHAPFASYVVIFFVLLALTASTVAIAFVDLGPFNTTVAVGIAVVKATLILAWFMHLKGENKLLWCFAAAGFFFMALLTIGAIDDELTREAPAHPELRLER